MWESVSHFLAAKIGVQNQQADHFWGMQQSADAYLAKPFDEAELLATVAQFLP